MANILTNNVQIHHERNKLCAINSECIFFSNKIKHIEIKKSYARKRHYLGLFWKIPDTHFFFSLTWISFKDLLFIFLIRNF